MKEREGLVGNFQFLYNLCRFSIWMQFFTNCIKLKETALEEEVSESILIMQIFKRSREALFPEGA